MAESEGKKNTVDDFSDVLIVEVSRFQLFTEIPDAYYLLSKPACEFAHPIYRRCTCRNSEVELGCMLISLRILKG